MSEVYLRVKRCDFVAHVDPLPPARCVKQAGHRDEHIFNIPKIVQVRAAARLDESERA